MQLRKIQILLLLACALSVAPGNAPRSFAAGPAGADGETLVGLTHIRVLPRVQATRSRVSLLDLCDPALIPEDWRQVLAAVDLGEAPEVGSRKYIQPEQLKQYLRVFLETRGLDPAKVAIDTPETIVIDRPSVTLTQDRIEAVYREYLQSHCGWPAEDLAIERVVVSGLAVVPAGDPSVEVKPVKDGMCLGNVVLTVDYSVAGEKVRSLRVAGRVSLVHGVFQARTALAKDTILQAGDLEAVRVNVGDDPNRYPAAPEEVEGKQLRRNLQPGEAIESRDLVRPLAVKRGDAVTIFYELPGFRLTAKGVVKENAAVGDRIQVINANSKRSIYCLVLDEMSVSVSP